VCDLDRSFSSDRSDHVVVHRSVDNRPAAKERRSAR